MSDVAPDPVTLGREAWQRIQERGRKSWQDWLTVATAVRIGRDAAMRTAGCNRPFGSRYSKAMGDWLSENQLDVGVQVRSRLMQILEHRSEIEAWRVALPEAARAKMNHPDSCYFGWKRSVTGKPARAPMSRPDRPHNRSGKHVAGRCTRLIYFNQSMIKRAATAMREHWGSNDVYKLAVVMLQAAIRNEADLLELLPPEPKPKPAPRRSAAPAALELQA